MFSKMHRYHSASEKMCSMCPSLNLGYQRTILRPSYAATLIKMCEHVWQQVAFKVLIFFIEIIDSSNTLPRNEQDPY